jgi:hypothetical protein
MAKFCLKYNTKGSVCWFSNAGFQNNTGATKQIPVCALLEVASWHNSRQFETEVT